MSLDAIEKLWHNCGTLKGHILCKSVCMARAMHSLISRKTCKDLKLSLLDDVEALCRQELKTKASLWAGCLSLDGVPQHTTNPLNKDWESYCLKASKEISI